MNALVLACVALALSKGADPGNARDVCAAISRTAPRAGLDAFQMAAIAWHESRFDPGKRSKTGCLGPMQVNPAWSPYTVQELARVDTGVEAGAVAALYWRGRKGDRWLHCYASGEDCRADGYVRKVEKTRLVLLRWANELGGGR